MSLSFREQLELLEPVFNLTLRKGLQLTICTGSGISRLAMPMLPRLIVRAFCANPPPEGIAELFGRYSIDLTFAARARERVPQFGQDPLTLDIFRTLTPEVQDHVCAVLCRNYGDVFQDLEEIYGNRQSLFEAIRFTEFQQGTPNPAHIYIGLLLEEKVVREAVTFNWDRLVEIALENYSNRALPEVAFVINDEEGWAQWREGLNEKVIKLHGCASQFPGELHKIVRLQNL